MRKLKRQGLAGRLVIVLQAEVNPLQIESVVSHARAGTLGAG